MRAHATRLVTEEHLLSALDGLDELGSILILSSCSPTRVMVFTAGAASRNCKRLLGGAVALRTPRSRGLRSWRDRRQWVLLTEQPEVGRLRSLDVESTILEHGLFDFVHPGLVQPLHASVVLLRDLEVVLNEVDS